MNIKIDIIIIIIILAAIILKIIMLLRNNYNNISTFINSNNNPNCKLECGTMPDGTFIKCPPVFPDAIDKDCMC